MATYSYAAASRFLKLCRGSNANTRAPAPYQMTMLVRILNAEILALFSAAKLKMKSIFGKGDKSPDLLEFSLLVFFVSMIAR